MRKEQIIKVLQAIINEIKENGDSYYVSMEIIPVEDGFSMKKGKLVREIKFERTLTINDRYPKQEILDDWNEW